MRKEKILYPFIVLMTTENNTKEVLSLSLQFSRETRDELIYDLVYVIQKLLSGDITISTYQNSSIVLSYALYIKQ